MGYFFEPTSMVHAIDDFRSEYNIARENRFKSKKRNVTGVARSADAHISSEWDWIFSIEYAREMERNNIVIGQGLNRLVDNVLPPSEENPSSLVPIPRTGDDTLDDDLRGLWKEWACDSDLCSWNGESTFRDLEKLTLRSMIRDGDVLHTPLSNGTLRAFEAHRCRTPGSRTLRRGVIHGVELSEDGTPIRYHFTKEEIDPGTFTLAHHRLKSVKTRDRDGNRRVLHVYDPKRFSQHRGVTGFAPIDVTASQFDDISLAKMMQSLATSTFGIIKEQEARIQPEDPKNPGNQIGSTESATLSDGTSVEINKLGIGLMWTGKPGEKLSAFSPNIPNESYFEHSKVMLTLLSINLGLPLAVFILDMSQHNFNSWRGAMDQARLGFVRLQEILRDRLHRHVWGWRIRNWISSGELSPTASENPNLLLVDWNLPKWPYIDPKEDIQSDLLEEAGLGSSPRRIRARRGVDWKTIISETVEDYSYAIETAHLEAERLNSAHPGLDLSWEDLLRLKVLPNMTGNSQKKDNAGTPLDQKTRDQNQTSPRNRRRIVVGR